MLLLVVACTPLVEVQGEWDRYLDSLPECETDDDCTVIEPGCPLGCYAGVPVGFEADAREVAAELVDRYRGPLRPCAQECTPPPAPDCPEIAGRRHCSTR